MNPGSDESVELTSDATFHQQEKQWVERSRQGDEAAFRPLFDHYFPKLYGTLYHMVRDAATAEDLTQAAMVQAWQRIDRFDGRSAFGTWLYRVGVNLALDHLRRRKNRPAESLDQAFEESGREPESDQAAPTAALEQSELARALARALDKLSDAHRAVFVLGEIQGLPYDEIGRILKCKRGTVMSRMHYARLHLQKLLRSHYDPE